MSQSLTLGQLYVMRLLLDGPNYGLAISRATDLKTGSMYPILHRLQSRGYVTAEKEVIDQKVEGRKARVYYTLTSEGVVYVRATLEEVLQKLEF